ncbi:hypothetical protein EXE41_17770 [Halorubrum sp. SD690R]|uniref:hypothetical protein n=1 Tax=Halorubrum sp. SD690R TaxID=2518117 RepID=UPI0010F750F0|nr:hypothetical protein [Halorubrum sp. SD690R]TKX41602.1 hypothetical protein EXE41_17770 [Halorubrum sp. SD690R]
MKTTERSLCQLWGYPDVADAVLLVVGVVIDRGLGQLSVACLSYCPTDFLLKQVLDSIFGQSIEKQWMILLDQVFGRVPNIVRILRRQKSS